MREVAYDDVFDSQTHYRVLLDSMARPGRIQEFASLRLAPPGELNRASAAVALALLNADVSFALAGFEAEVGEYIAVNTFSSAADAATADFLFFADGDQRPDLLAAAKPGLPTYPEWGATAVVQLQELSPEPVDGALHVKVEGPGVDGAAHFHAKGLHPVFLGTLKEKNQEFPLGVDVILTCGERVLSLPRSSRISWS